MMDTSLVAVVDDEESVRRALGRLLRAAGFAVEAFSSGAEFLDSLQARAPDCIVLDLWMPRLSGFQVQEALRSGRVRAPVVVITGDDAPESRERSVALGAVAYLRKPVDDRMLLEALNAALHHSS